jgi:predicted TIM-barrel fold metal-dependent hydrolase
MDTPLRRQIDAVFHEVVVPHQGKIHPFVPFDPARELAYRKGLISPDGQLETDRPLDLVRNAVEEKGFIGVKLYNSLGYRPFGNGDPEVTLKRQRIAVRNNKMSYLFDGEEYDEVLCDLYDYCVENQVPVTAHCVMNGIEAYPGASFDFGRAIFWEEVLRQEKYRKLRLNLAHFGWNQEGGQGYAGNESWVRDICGLMVNYDNVYADVSHHRVLTGSGRRMFIEGYRQMQADYSSGIDTIRNRILYGSDWHVLRRIKGYREFLDRYEQVLTASGLYDRAQLDRFRGGNALEFLGLIAGGANRQRLLAFYQSNGITIPEWYRPAAGPANAINTPPRVETTESR